MKERIKQKVNWKDGLIAVLIMVTVFMTVLFVKNYKEIKDYDQFNQTHNCLPFPPKMLVIGDSIAQRYFPILKEEFLTDVNLTITENADGSDNGVIKIKEWVGEEKWDVISYNFGAWDFNMPKEEYQANIENITRQLEKTGAKLIWVTTTPLPRNFGHVNRTNSKIEELNKGAEAVLAQHPEVKIVDTWSIVTNNPLYHIWWEGNDPHFNDRQSEPMARAISKEVRILLDLYDKEAVPVWQ